MLFRWRSIEKLIVNILLIITYKSIFHDSEIKLKELKMIENDPTPGIKNYSDLLTNLLRSPRTWESIKYAKRKLFYSVVAEFTLGFSSIYYLILRILIFQS